MKELALHRMSLAKVSADTKQSCPKHNLLNIPHEIQSMIFDLAYSRPPGLRLRCRYNWGLDEVIRMKSSPFRYTMRPFPNVKVSEFLVSKQFFVGAAKAYVESRAFEDGISFALKGSVTGPVCGIVPAFAKEIVQNAGDVITGRYKDLPNLKIWNLGLDEFFFMELLPKCAWKDVLTECDFEKLPAYEDLCKASGLIAFTVFSQKCYFVGAERQIWYQNLKALESAVQSHVIRPKTMSTPRLSKSSSVQRTPLYSGSAVCFGTSTLQSSEACELDLEDELLEDEVQGLRDLPVQERSLEKKCFPATIKLQGGQHLSKADLVELQEGTALRRDEKLHECQTGLRAEKHVGLKPSTAEMDVCEEDKGPEFANFQVVGLLISCLVLVAEVMVTLLGIAYSDGNWIEDIRLYLLAVAYGLNGDM